MSGEPKIGGNVLRPEIQALRALAVALVVVYHLWPARLAGGYVGVDVFFVISGFLITSHIVRGVVSDKRFSISHFYVRRIRRLLPASLTVLLVVGVITLSAVPQTLWLDYGRQIVASALYVENWLLAFNSVDYLALGSNSSPVQHFWSLSAEEQFYIAWPVLLLAAAGVAMRFRRSKITGITVVVIGVTVLSLAYSIYATATDPAFAYFITPTRAWEFGMGGIAALAITRPLRNRVIAAILGWTGIAVIVGVAFFYDSATPFPGYTALLPVLATIGVIVAGDVERKWAPSIIANLRPVQFLGDISYSVYLWHWPLIVLLPVIVGGVGTDLTTPMRLCILFASVALGWLSKRLIEDRFRSPSPRRPQVRSWPVFASMAGAMAIVVAVGGVAVATTSNRISVAEAELASFEQGDISCYGAAALEARDACGPLSGTVYPNPLIARASAAVQGCQQRAARAEVIECSFGDTATDATRVALVGDSHANQWLGAAIEIAEQDGWNLTTYFKSSCGFSQVAWSNDSCTTWNDRVSDSISAGDFDLVIVSSASVVSTIPGPPSSAFKAAVGGVVDAWSPIVEEGTPIAAIADTPNPGKAGLSDPPSCVFEGGDCAFSQEPALARDPIVEAAAMVNGVSLIDMTGFFCRDGMCPSVIGDVLVYRDDNHMTTVYSRTLAPFLLEQLPAI